MHEYWHLVFFAEHVDKRVKKRVDFVRIPFERELNAFQLVNGVKEIIGRILRNHQFNLPAFLVMQRKRGKLQIWLFSMLLFAFSLILSWEERSFHGERDVVVSDTDAFVLGQREINVDSRILDLSHRHEGREEFIVHELVYSGERSGLDVSYQLLKHFTFDRVEESVSLVSDVSSLELHIEVF